jgi:uncharacterized protein (DUF1684 family)
LGANPNAVPAAATITLKRTLDAARKDGRSFAAVASDFQFHASRHLADARKRFEFASKIYFDETNDWNMSFLKISAQ